MTGRVDDRGQLVKAEGNFEDHPYFTVGNQRGGEGVIRYSNTIRTRDGQELKQTWTVRAVQGLGLPGTLDQDVYVALLQLIDRQGDIPKDGWIGFSIYELVELLRRTHGGRDYRQIKESLERLSGTIIQSKNAFYRKSTKSYLDDTFHLLDRVQHSETEDRAGRRAERTWVKLSEYFVDSYKANYLKGLDADFYWSLNSSVAKRLYRFVDKKRNQQSRWEVDLFSLRDRIPLSPYPYPSKIKEKLAPAHEELRQKGFIEEVTYRKTGEGKHLVCYEIHAGFSSRRPTPQPHQSPEDKIAFERLKAEGLRAVVAQDLVATHGPERCSRYVEAVAFQKHIRNRAGWLRKAIQNGYELDAPPPAAPTRSAVPPGPNGSANGSVGEWGEAPPPEPPVPAESPPDEDPRARAVWDSLLAKLSETIDATSYGIWLGPLIPTSYAGSELTLHAPNGFAADYIRTRFDGPLQSAIVAVAGDRSTLVIASPEPDAHVAGKPE
jgi:plasmid replication initiation protein